jgi:hypothetical protein
MWDPQHLTAGPPRPITGITFYMQKDEETRILLGVFTFETLCFRSSERIFNSEARKHNDFMIQCQFILDVNSALSSHYVDIGNVTEVSEALAGSIFRAEARVVTAILIIHLCPLFR